MCCSARPLQKAPKLAGQEVTCLRQGAINARVELTVSPEDFVRHLLLESELYLCAFTEIVDQLTERLSEHLAMVALNCNRIPMFDGRPPCKKPEVVLAIVHTGRR